MATVFWIAIVPAMAMWFTVPRNVRAVAGRVRRLSVAPSG